MIKKAEIIIFTPKECPHRCSRYDTLWTDAQNVDKDVYYICDHIKTSKTVVTCDDDEHFPKECPLKTCNWTNEV